MAMPFFAISDLPRKLNCIGHDNTVYDMTESAFEIRDAIRAHAPVILVLRDIIAAYAVPIGDLLMLMPHVFPVDNFEPMDPDELDSPFCYAPKLGISLTIHLDSWYTEIWLIQLQHGIYNYFEKLRGCDDPFALLLARTSKHGGPSSTLMRCIDGMRAYLDSNIAKCQDFLLHGPRANS